MAISSFLAYSFLVIMCSCLVITSAAANTVPKSHVPLFIFGDSLFDPGNNPNPNTTSSRYPYGETYFKRPTGRISDGRIVPDFIAEFFKLPLWTPYIKPVKHEFTNGANFAAGGAGVLTQTHPGTINLRMQLGYFKQVEKVLKQKLGDAETRNLLSRAVFFFSIGGNDYFGFGPSHPNATEADHKQYVGMVIGNTTQVLREIYNIGGRKFGFQNVGPLGCTPGSISKSGACDKYLLTLASQHNYALPGALKALASRLPGLKYSIFDYYRALLDRALHPSKYGFVNGKYACCGGNSGECGTKPGLCSDPSKYVWWDQGHTTEACNWQLAKLIWKGKQDVTAPYNFKQLYESM